MRRAHFYFGLIFWTVYLLVMVWHCYHQGMDTLSKSVKTKGQVIEQIAVSTRHSIRYRPRIQYLYNDSAYLFVDHAVSLGNGETPTLLYDKANFKHVYVYTFWFWVDFSVIVPSFLICLLVFWVVCILTTKYKAAYFILPSHVDKFQ